MNRLFAAVAVLVVFGLGVLVGANKFGSPNTLLQVVTVKWKADSTTDQRTQALDGVKKMAGEVPGIKNVWTKTVKVQPREYNAVFAIEFESKAALDAYAEHPAHA